MAPEFILIVYGAKWLPAVPALRVLAVAAGIYCASQVTAPTLMAMGRPGLWTKMVSGSSLVLLVGALVGVRYGIVGVALGVLAAGALPSGFRSTSLLGRSR